MNKLKFIDWSRDDEEIVFYSDCDQKFVDSISFIGGWEVIRREIIEWGYSVLDEPVLN
jgi:hypothetical protein